MHDTVDVLTPESGTSFWIPRAPQQCEPATRCCADVSKLMYHMRISGDLLDQVLLVAFDGQLRASVSASLSGDLLDHFWW